MSQEHQAQDSLARPQLSPQQWYTPQDQLRLQLEQDRRARQEAYRHAPHDLEEHLGIEASIAQGGYATRQIHELIQNGADAVFRQGEQHGWLEVCLSPTHLYVANTGAALDGQGLRTLLQAHVSRKRTGEIGRFGVGFKAVLKVTDRPQIFSRSLCVGFDAQRAQRALDDALPELKITRSPALRMAWELDPWEQDDPILAELLSWATTVVRLPLKDEQAAHALSRELMAFDSAFLLFTPTSLALTFRDLSRPQAPVTRQIHKRHEPIDLGQGWLLTDGEQTRRWSVLSTRFELNDERAILDAGERHARGEYELHWALPWGEEVEQGRFWVFSPLEELLSIPGILNAPWKVSDDRRHILPGAFNEALITQAAGFILTQYERMGQRAQDPGAALGFMPAGQVGGWADTRITEALNKALETAPLFPDVHGQRAKLADLRLHPRELPTALIEAWSELVTRQGHMPHLSCYQHPRRRQSLEGLASEDAFRGLIPWLEATRQAGRLGAVSFARLAWRALKSARDEVQSARQVPTHDGRWVALNDDALFLGDPQEFGADCGLSFVHPEVLARQELAEFLRQVVRLRRPQTEDLVRAAVEHHAPLLKEGRDDEVWAWLERAVGSAEEPALPVSVARELTSRADAGELPMLRLMTQGAGLQDGALAYLDDAGQGGDYALDAALAARYGRALLEAAGFTPRLVTRAARDWPLDPSCGALEGAQVWPLGPWLDGHQPLSLTLSQLALAHYEQLDPLMREAFSLHGCLPIHEVPVALATYPTSWPAPWEALAPALDPQAVALLQAQRADPPSRRSWSDALWSCLDALALEHPEEGPRRAYYGDALAHGHAPRQLQLDGERLAITSLMVTGDEALAERGRAFGWHVLCLDRGSRLNAMKSGARLLTGVPHLEPGHERFMGSLAELLGEFLHHLVASDEPSLAAIKVIAYDHIQEVLVSTRGRQEREVGSLWLSNTLHLALGDEATTWPQAREQLLDALIEHELVPAARVERARSILDPTTRAPGQQLERLFALSVGLEDALRAHLGCSSWPAHWGSIGDELWRVLGQSLAPMLWTLMGFGPEHSPQHSAQALGLPYTEAAPVSAPAPAEEVERWADRALEKTGRTLWSLAGDEPWELALCAALAGFESSPPQVTLWLGAARGAEAAIERAITARGAQVARFDRWSTGRLDPEQAQLWLAPLEMTSWGSALGRFDDALTKVSRVIVDDADASSLRWIKSLVHRRALAGADWIILGDEPSVEAKLADWSSLGFEHIHAPAQRASALDEPPEQALSASTLAQVARALFLAGDAQEAAKLALVMEHEGISAATWLDVNAQVIPQALVSAAPPQALAHTLKGFEVLAIKADEPGSRSMVRRWAPWRAWHAWRVVTV